MAKNNYDPVGTLSIGNVVTTGTILYKSNFKRYFQVSLRATGWLLAIGFLLVGLGIVGGILFGLTNSQLSLVPVGLGGVVATLYFVAKYATNRAVICRLAYQDLIDAPETVAVATQQLAPRTWGFLRLAGLVGFYLLLVALISYFILGILMVMVIAAATYGFGLSIDNPNPFFLVCIGLFILGLILLWIVILIRYYAYWFIAELPLAIEQTRSANFSIDRSKQLSNTAARRVTLIITIAFLITLPINAIGNLPSFIGQIMTSVNVANNPSTQAMGGGLIFVGFFLNLLGELFVMPFWQTIKAIVYYDLRNRREGGDLII
jgi:hypothetical protein